MELLPTGTDHDAVAEKVRQFSATKLTELIMGLAPFVQQALADPTDVLELEPARIQANMTVIKMHTTLIKELGALYQVTARPAAKADPDMVPLREVERLLSEAAVRTEELVAAAVLETEARVRGEVEARQQLSLEAARTRVTAALSKLQP